MTLDGPRQATREELASLVELADQMFRKRRLTSVRDDLPLLFNEDNLDNLRVFTDGGRAVSLVGMVRRDVRPLGTRHSTCCLGAVCTNPDYRGQGLATRLMEDARNKALADGVSIILISGGRSLYRRLGYVDVGGYGTCTVRREQMPEDGGYTSRRWLPEDIPAMVEIHCAEPVRFARTPEDFRAMLGTGRMVNAQGDVRVICPAAGGRPVAYIAYEVGGAPWEDKPPDAILVIEMAGPRWAVAQGLARLLDERRADMAEADRLESDGEFLALAQYFGWPVGLRGFRGTAGIIAPARFWEACASLFRERLGDERFARLGLRTGECLAITWGDERLELDGMSGLTNVAFLPRRRRGELAPSPAPGSALAAVLDELFPLPLVDYGLNYV